MTRRLPLCLLVSLLAIAPVRAPAADDEQTLTRQVWELLKASHKLVNEGNLEEAENKLLQARALSPQYAEVYAHLGYVYELRGKRTDALHAYAELLRRRPKHEYATTHLQSLFYEGPFPRNIAVADMEFSPVHFVFDRCLLTLSDGTEVVGVAYTDDLLFHEEMERGGPPVEIEVPATGGTAKALINRSAYGYISAPGSESIDLEFILSYPSKLISASQTDYHQTAPRLTHLLLRAYWYFSTYLGKQPPVEGPVKAYLLEQGPPGAEAYSNALYFYSADTPRTPVEWARQIGHEYGHLVLPPVGRYVEPEFYASGLLGERLFIQWLAEEAQAVEGVAWPHAAAQDALDKLLGGEQKFDAVGYLARTVYADLQMWHDRGPEAAFIAGTGEESMHYWLGFMMWVEAALGKEGLREVMDAAPGTSPADFLYALKFVVLRKHADNGCIRFKAGSLSMVRSRISTPPTQGILGWTNVKLADGDSAFLTMYVPDGVWGVRTHPGSSALSLTFDGKGPLPMEPDRGVRLGKVAEGWHTFELSSNGRDVKLDDIELICVPQA